MKEIVHIDLNAFFAQVEILENPQLRGKPIAVGSDYRRGVLSTASYEARKFGVNSGLPVSEAKRLCPELILVEPHFHKYKEYSRKFFGYLKSRFPLMEQASIDEAYFDMTSYLIPGKEQEMLFDLQITLYKVTRLKCSIGCGANRFVAKMGSDLRKPLGLTIIHEPEVKTLLWPLPIEKMYGIGKKTAPRLRMFGIETIKDLATTSDPKVKKELGKRFQSFFRNANGFGSDEIDTSSWDPKSISAEHTFSEDVTDYEELKEMVVACSVQVYSELQRYHKTTNVVSVKLRTGDFVTRSKRMSFDQKVFDQSTMNHYAMTVFEQFYQGQPVRLIGVGAESVEDIPGSVETEKKKDPLLDSLNSSLQQGGQLFLASDLEEEK